MAIVNMAIVLSACRIFSKVVISPNIFNWSCEYEKKNIVQNYITV